MKRVERVEKVAYYRTLAFGLATIALTTLLIAATF